MNNFRIPQTRQGWLQLLVVAAVLGSGWIFYSRDPISTDTSTLATAPLPGALAPDFTLTTLEGESITLSDLRGQPVIINFWATWCGPCRQETPHFQTFYEQNHPDVVMLGINQRESTSTVINFVEEFGMTYPVLLDENGSVYDTYQVFGLPTTWFVNPDGVLVSVAPGGITAAFLEDQLSKSQN